MDDTPWWFPLARGLADGQRLRGDHDCGDPGTLLMSRTDGTYAVYCFRCGFKDKHREQESVQDRLARFKAGQERDEAAQATSALPEPREYDPQQWPAKALLWFLKCGFGPRLLRESGMYWCSSMQRVVVPVFDGQYPMYWLARSHERTPKWLTPNVPKNGLAYKCGERNEGPIVLMEDPLSAFKVGQVTEAWSLLGTKLHARHAARLLELGRPVVVWMDNDRGRRLGSNPGQEAARSIARQLRALGLPVRIVKTDRDPKYYPTAEIQEVLK